MDLRITHLNGFIESASDAVKAQFLETIAHDPKASKAINCLNHKKGFMFVIHWALFEDIEKIYRLMLAVQRGRN